MVPTNGEVKPLVLILGLHSLQLGFPYDALCVEVQDLGGHQSDLDKLLVNDLGVNLDKPIDQLTVLHEELHDRLESLEVHRRWRQVRLQKAFECLWLFRLLRGQSLSVHCLDLHLRGFRLKHR